VAKGWVTDLGVEITSLAMQVHGGMGYIEETGVAQHYPEPRIAPIYEGTNGIQAIDLVTHLGLFRAPRQAWCPHRRPFRRMRAGEALMAISASPRRSEAPTTSRSVATTMTS